MNTLISNKRTMSAHVETTPLLSTSPDQIKSHSKTRHPWHWIRIVGLCVAIAIFFDIGDYLILAPRVRLYESITCTQHYLIYDPSILDQDGSIPEQLCKIDVIQDKVAKIFGLQLFFDSLPSILLPIPVGRLADRYGRKWFCVLSMLGFMFSYFWTLLVVITAMLLQVYSLS
jgi:hypothetical protein